MFGCVLLSDEKVETYKWVLENFSKAIFNKHLKAVVTDGDAAIWEVVKQVNSTHKILCMGFTLQCM